MRCWCRRRFGLILTDAVIHRDKRVPGHQLGDFCRLSVAKRTSRFGEDSDKLAGAPVAAALDDRDAGNMVLLHQGERVGQRRIGMMVTGFTTMPDSNFLTCRTCPACTAGSRLR